jgi:hypothetical protein
MKLISKITATLLFLWLFCMGFIGMAAAQKASTGSVVGTIQDKNSENPLPGATVTADGTLFTATADRIGQFRLAGLPVGSHNLRISYIGYNSYSIDVDVKAGETLEVNALLLPYLRLTVEVTAPLLEGQEKALNEQNAAMNIENVVAADQIGNFAESHVHLYKRTTHSFP